MSYKSKSFGLSRYPSETRPLPAISSIAWSSMFPSNIDLLLPVSSYGKKNVD